MISAKIKLFGEFRIELSTGQHVPLSGRKGPSIITLLLLTPEHSEYRDRLVNLLWSRSSQDSGRASLRQTLSELRRQFQAVGLDIVGADPQNIDRIELAREKMSADILDFQRFDQAKTVGASQKIVDLYQGQLLGAFESRDIEFMDWLNAHRRWFEDKVIEHLKYLVQVMLDEGDYKSTSKYATELLKLDHGNEFAYRAQMQRCAESGEHAAAITLYLECKQVLQNDFSAAPSFETESLYEKICKGDYKKAATTDVQSFKIHNLPVAANPTLISVLPFIFTGARSETTESMSEISSDLSIALTKFKWMRVSTSGVGTRIASSEEELSHARSLSVRFLIQGKIRSSNNVVRVSIDLVDTYKEQSVWAEQFDSTTSDLLTVQDEIVARIASQTDVRLRLYEMHRAHHLSESHLGPNEYVLRAIYQMHKMTRESFLLARKHFVQAAALDPDYPSIYTWRSYWEIFFVGQGWNREEGNENESYQRKASKIVHDAIRRDPEDSLALAISGHFEAFLFKHHDAALELFRRSLTLNPYSAFSWMLSSATYSYIGEPDEALRRLERSQYLCPIEPHYEFLYNSAKCVAYAVASCYEDSVIYGRLSVTDNPGFSNGIKQLLIGLGHLEQYSEAKEYLDQLLQLDPNFTVAKFVRDYPMRRPEDLKRLAQGLIKAGVPLGEPVESDALKS